MKRLMMTAAIAIAALATTTTTATAADYTIDNGHSMAVFSVKHLGVGNFWGVFHHVTGAVSYDKANVAASTVKLTIKSGSIFTADKKRDGHLKSPDFLNAKEFPTMTFESTSVKAAGAAMDVTGKLTLRGKTNRVTAKVTFTGEGKDPWGNNRAGWEARLTIKRSQFGITTMPGGLGEEISLIIAVEGIKK